MSRHRVTDAIDSLLGTTSFRGGVVHSRHGVYTDTDGLDAQDATDGLTVRGDSVGVCTPRRHSRLTGDKRCEGCGRTCNEIEIDGGNDGW